MGLDRVPDPFLGGRGSRGGRTATDRPMPVCGAAARRRPTGEAYIELATAEDAAAALKAKQHQHIGSRYIE